MPIFQYQRANKINLSNLEKQILYMASPSQFNDPYDCDINYDLIDYSREDAGAIKRKFIELEVSPQNRELLKALENEQFLPELIKVAQKVFEVAHEVFLKNSGICCFSEINDNLLMWAHYCEGYRGFCLEFRTEYEPFLRLHQVQYIDAFKRIDFVNQLLSENGEFITDLYCTKSKNWDYEKEWRIIHHNAKTEYRYVQECLKAIYFGPKIENEYKKNLCSILKRQNPKVELWDGELAKKRFEINFNRVDNCN
jgi:hypothetical protein